MFPQSLFSSRRNTPDDTLFRENQLLKSQINQLLSLEETGFFIELDSLLRAILKKALILCQADSSFFALTSEDPTELDVRICNLILEEKMQRLQALFRDEYARWQESESPIITLEDFIVLPLLRRHRLLGIIGLKLNSDAPENVCEILPILARQAAASLESAILYERMFKRLLVLSNVFILGKEIVTNIDLNSLVDKFLSIARDGSNSEVAAIYLLREPDAEPHFTRVQIGGGSGKPVTTPLAITPLIRQVCREQKPITVDNLAQSAFAETEPGKFAGIALQNTFAMPLVVHDRFLGVIQMANKIGRGGFTSEDLDLLKILSGQIAFVIQNANLFQNLQSAYINTLGALTSAIDAKDSYTHGHSERVTELSVMLGREIAISSEELENLRIAGLLHDIGKIGIPEGILNKPGRLTDEEFEIIKSHPDLGVRILKKVEFLHPIIPFILHHHERFDGRGYPAGLAGDRIPLCARIITVADTYDAMTSDRPYRKALDQQTALEEVLRCKGTQFDPQVAEAFVKLMNRQASGMIP